MTQWHTFDTREDMVESLREATTRELLRSILKNGRASWAVSGGSTPAPLFEVMTNVLLDWSRVQIALVDERWVDIDHPRSNEAFMKQHLKKGSTAKARFVGMKTPHGNPFDAEADVASRYAALNQPFNSILLGMGPDGHTASFFPEAEGLEKALDPQNPALCTALTAKRSDVTGDEVDRMSLTASAIMAANHVVLMITGTEKKQVLEDALSGNADYPVGRLAKLKPFEVYWAP